jgi:hypothetical protein
VLTALTLGKVRRRLGTAAAVRRPGGPGRSGPVAAPPVELMELGLSCAGSAVVGGPAMSVCRSSRKDGDGDSTVSTNWPGRISCEPNTASAGEN